MPRAAVLSSLSLAAALISSALPLRAGDLVRCSLAGEVLVYVESEWCAAREDGRRLGLIEPAAGPTEAPVPALTVVEAQRMLRDLGYRPGPLDGIWGPRTEAALQAFLADRGLDGVRLDGPAKRALYAAWRKQAGPEG